MLQLLADAASDPMGGWWQVILQSGAFGLLTYIVVYIAPRAVSEAARERTSREVNFQASQAELQRCSDERTTRLVELFVGLVRDERTTCQKWHDEHREDNQQFRKAIGQLGDETRENRHSLNNLSHQLGLRQAVENERKRQEEGDAGGK